jgi:hypothetical protein
VQAQRKILALYEKVILALVLLGHRRRWPPSACPRRSIRAAWAKLWLAGTIVTQQRAHDYA